MVDDDLLTAYSVACEATYLWESLLTFCDSAVEGGKESLLKHHAESILLRINLVNDLHQSQWVHDAFPTRAAFVDVTNAAVQLGTEMAIGGRFFGTAHQLAVALAFDAGTMLAVAKVVDCPFLFSPVGSDQIVAKASDLAMFAQSLRQEIEEVGGVYRVRAMVQKEHTAAVMARESRRASGIARPQSPPFVPRDFQQLILTELQREEPQTAVQLMANLNCSRDTLFGKNGKKGLTELVEAGYVEKVPKKEGYARSESGRKQTQADTSI